MQSAQISQKQDGRNIYATIMKTMYPPGYHHNGLMATHALGHMMYGYYTYINTTIDQTTYFRKCILASQSRLNRHPVRNNCPLRILNTCFSAIFLFLFKKLKTIKH